MKRLFLTAGLLFCLSLTSVARAANERMQPDNSMRHDDTKPMSNDKMQSGDKMESGQTMKAQSKTKSKKEAGDDNMAAAKMHKDGKM